jgi:hypothetical protein
MAPLRHLGSLALAAALVVLTATPASASEGFAVGTRAEDAPLHLAPGVRPYLSPGVVPFALGWAVPLRGARPSWYTAELEREVLAANGAPLAAPLDAPLPSEVGIRPGSWMIAPHGCTMNFVFAQGSSFAIGTAGHCTDRIGDRVVLLTLLPGTSNPVLVDIGSVIRRHDGGIGDDFALVSIRPELNPWVSATTAVVGGPCGTYLGSGPESVWHYGHGLAIGTGGTPRAGVALTWNANSFGWAGAAIFGDSGSPVRVTNLNAAGDLTHLVVNSAWLPSFIAGTRIAKMLQIASGWSLASSQLCL